MHAISSGQFRAAVGRGLVVGAAAGLVQVLLLFVLLYLAGVITL